jgi:hypothetical protein
MNLLVDQGGFRIEYREPVLGGNRASFHKTDTVSNAVAEFNTLEHTSLCNGEPFATPLRITRINTMGEQTHVFTQQGRYDVPVLVGGTHMDSYERRERRRYRRYSKRSGDRG